LSEGEGLSATAGSPTEELRILVVRADRLGDVILSTPVFDAIRNHYPSAQVYALVREPVASILTGLRSVQGLIIYEPEGRHRGFKGFRRLVGELRAGRFRIAVVLQSQWRLAVAIFLAGIPYRLGPLSKLYSFLLYNRGMRQHRSQVEMHETDYNLQLLQKLGIRVGTRSIATRARVSSAQQTRADAWLRAAGWDGAESFIAIHPGMGNSALNWPEESYAQLGRQLLKDGKRVLLTGGLLESELLARIQGRLGDSSRLMVYVNRAGDPVDFLGALYARAAVLVAPSTGPMHLAVAVGRPVVTFYPPIRVQSAIRWGPYLADDKRVAVLVPEVYCGEDFRCRGTLCNYYPCMASLTVAQAREEIVRLSAAEPTGARALGDTTHEEK
jgi:ADP-heptose:LPS heptosyltransferase